MLTEVETPSVAARRKAAALTATLPPAVTLTERAAAALRAYLVTHELGDYRIFAGNLDLHDLERNLSRMGESAAKWEPLPSVAGGEVVEHLTSDESLAPPGVLHLGKFKVVIARWFWVETDYMRVKQLWLVAAPSPDCYEELHSQLLRHRHTRGAGVWQIVRGFSHADGPRTRRQPVGDDELILAPELRRRIDSGIIRFFSDEVAELYRQMNVPYRRGVLLHGPAGNGKTSIIRLIGAAVMHIPVLVLRPYDSFDSDDLEEIIRRWSTQAPAILVIEDLNWLLKKVDVSMFLNLLDGVESQLTGGLMVIATTNYPEQLDPAINNRPGRFDVVIQVDPPEAPQRLEFLRRRLAGISSQTIEQLVAMSDRLSFAHLQEIVRLSGLLAIEAARTARCEADVLNAAKIVIDGYDAAVRGFPRKPEMPFGFAHLRKASK